MNENPQIAPITQIFNLCSSVPVTGLAERGRCTAVCHQSKYKSEHLILLIGGNPLPNAVAGMALGNKKGRITLKQTNQPSIGLNYTGGTKTMSVHAYRAVKFWADENRGRPVFSYLDARTLEMVFDPEYPASGQASQKVSMELMPQIELSDLFALHGWTNRSDPTDQPFLPQTSAQLLQVYQNRESLEQWKQWKTNVLHKECRRQDRPGNTWLPTICLILLNRRIKILVKTQIDGSLHSGAAVRRR